MRRVAFVTICLVWGSTYLAIRYGLQSLPPYLLAGMRFFVSGAALLGIAWLRGSPAPSIRSWPSEALTGALLFVGGAGSVTWAEQRVPSGIAAIVVATVPLWMTLLHWRPLGAARPDLVTASGLTLGLAGVGLLGAPLRQNDAFDGRGIAVLAMSALSWSLGSHWSRRTARDLSPLTATGMQMLSGGALLLCISAGTGELGRLDPRRVTASSLLALGYLIVFGSIVAFTAYAWLLRVASPSRVASYAYVNPAVAVLLGWLVGGEPITARALAAGTAIAAAVSLIALGARAPIHSHQRSNHEHRVRRAFHVYRDTALSEP